MKLNIFVTLALSSSILTLAAPLPQPGITSGWGAVKKIFGKSKGEELSIYAPDFYPDPKNPGYGGPQFAPGYRGSPEHSRTPSPEHHPSTSAAPASYHEHPQSGAVPEHFAAPRVDHNVGMTHEYPRSHEAAAPHYAPPTQYPSYEHHVPPYAQHYTPPPPQHYAPYPYHNYGYSQGYSHHQGYAYPDQAHHEYGSNAHYMHGTPGEPVPGHETRPGYDQHGYPTGTQTERVGWFW